MDRRAVSVRNVSAQIDQLKQNKRPDFTALCTTGLQTASIGSGLDRSV
jgi:hypothetical protein